jgi:hypothetical protein
MFITLMFVGILIVYIYRHNEKFKRFWQLRHGDKYRSVHHANPHNDTERPPSVATATSIGVLSSSPAKLVNGTATVNTGSTVTGAVIYRPSPRISKRPQSAVGARAPPPLAPNCATVNDIKRTSSVRLQDISSPRLQSSTNRSVAAIARSNTVIANGCPDGMTVDSCRLIPTRAAPAPPQPVQDPHHRVAPNRPPLPSPNLLNAASTAAAGRELPSKAPATVATTPNHYEQIPLTSPLGPAPVPPDSRHLFYSSQHMDRPVLAASESSAVARSPNRRPMSITESVDSPVTAKSELAQRSRHIKPRRPASQFVVHQTATKAVAAGETASSDNSRRAGPPKSGAMPAPSGVGKHPIASSPFSRPYANRPPIGKNESPRTSVAGSVAMVNESQC